MLPIESRENRTVGNAIQPFDIHWGMWPVESSTATAARQPYEAIVGLRVEGAEGQAFGSGWRVTPTRIVTAKHVVRPPEFASAPLAITALPFGAQPVTLQTAAVRLHRSLDLATIDVPQNAIGSLSPRAYSDATLSGRTVAVAGRPMLSDGQVSSGLVWFAAPISDVEAETVEYARMSTFRSHSGSPVLALSHDGRSYAVVGIHVADQKAVRISPAIRQWLVS
jgi:hypothetical protein